MTKHKTRQAATFPAILGIVISENDIASLRASASRRGLVRCAREYLQAAQQIGGPSPDLFPFRGHPDRVDGVTSPEAGKAGRNLAYMGVGFLG